MSALQDKIALAAKGDESLVWLDGMAYGSKVLLNDKPFPWTNVTEFVSSYGQLQSLLKPDVAPLPIADFLAQWLASHSSVLADMSGKKRIRFAIKKLLGMNGPRNMLREMVGSLCDSLSQPVVLVLTPNGDLINWANQMANQAEPVQICELDVDSVSVYLADFLRIFAGLDVAGVLIRLPEGTEVNAELLDLYSPLINVSRHYKWAVGVQVDKPVSIDDSDSLLNYVISNRSEANGQVLDADFWSGGSFNKTPSNFYYAEIDPSLQPELVLERLASLRVQG